MKKILSTLLFSLFVFTAISCIFILFDKPTSINNNEETKVNVDFSELSYVAFGDSITYGVDGVNGGRMANPYPNLVADELNFKSVTNKAVSGAVFCTNTLNRTNMTQTILNFKGEADIISLMLGVNDKCVNLPLGTTTSRDNSTIYGSLHLICEYLTKNYADSFIFVMTPFKYSGYASLNSQGYDLEDVADAIKWVCGKYDIPVLDMFELGNYEVEMSQSNSDGLHPSQEFFEEYTAPQIVDFIKNNYA